MDKVPQDGAQLEYGPNTEKVLPDAGTGLDSAVVLHEKLYLSEEDAYIRAVARPDDPRPMYIIYAQDDPDNPRNWVRWKKWYITVIASLANVITYNTLPMSTMQQDTNSSPAV